VCRLSDSGEVPFASAEVARIFAQTPPAARPGLLHLRRLIFEVAGKTSGAGPVKEALRWGQPAYLTAETGVGTTLRLGAPKTGGFALYAHCRTTVIATFRDRFGDSFCYQGNRAVLFSHIAEIQPDKLSLLIVHALTYHYRPDRRA